MSTYRITLTVRQEGAIGIFEGKDFQVTTPDGLVGAIKQVLSSARRLGYEPGVVTKVQEWLPDEGKWLPSYEAPE